MNHYFNEKENHDFIINIKDIKDDYSFFKGEYFNQEIKLYTTNEKIFSSNSTFLNMKRNKNDDDIMKSKNLVMII